MSLEKAKNHLTKFGLEGRIKEFDVSSATVALAAEALGTEEARIAKSLSFMGPDSPILIIAAGDAKVNNAKYRAEFGIKARMLPFESVEELIGHGVGGVCPFGINTGVKVYLDESLKRFDIVYPAAGTASSAVELSIDELEKASESLKWVNVCVIPEDNA